MEVVICIALAFIVGLGAFFLSVGLSKNENLSIGISILSSVAMFLILIKGII